VRRVVPWGKGRAFSARGSGVDSLPQMLPIALQRPGREGGERTKGGIGRCEGDLVVTEGKDIVAICVWRCRDRLVCRRWKVVRARRASGSLSSSAWRERARSVSHRAIASERRLKL
jgi:hypothetical protein